MTRTSLTRAVSATVIALAMLTGPVPRVGAAEPLAPAVVQALGTSRYVYIATQRKDGNFGTPAEIWFMWDQGAVWVASPRTAFRAKRIRAGRPAARIAVGSRTGPTFAATGTIVRDAAAYARLYGTFARKYPDGWPKYEMQFRGGLKDGSRVLMRYQPVAASVASPASGSPRPSPSP